jgi:ABC-type transport system involved in cytochrome c biogenesis permease component
MNTWWLVCRKELREIWIGGRALNLIIGYTLLLSLYSYFTVKGSAANFVPPKEMVYEALKLVMMVGVFMGLIIGADSLSGERERSTLESLLLTPGSRRQIVVGKFLAAASPWPVALAIAIPYLRVLSQGDEVFGQAVLWGVILGTTLTPAFTALGMLVSFWSSNNKTSLFMSLILYLLFVLPTTLSGHAQGGFMGLLFQRANPLAAPRVFLASVLVNNWTLERARPWLVSPVLFAILIFVALFWYAGPGLRLAPGRAVRPRLGRMRGHAAGIVAALVALLCLTPLRTGSAAAQEPAAGQGATPAQLQIGIDLDAKVVQAGATVLYNTVVTNTGAVASPPLIIAMNIINLDAQGEVVDPEDWSPQRTQYRDPLAPGESATLSWRINAILDGEFMVYMVGIPSPESAETTTQPVASSGIHLTVTPFTKLNPGGVLPYAIGGPVLLGLVIVLVYRHRRRQIDAGGE